MEPARAGMAAGLVNTLRQVGTAGGVAVIGALYASRVTTACTPQLPVAGRPPRLRPRGRAVKSAGARHGLWARWRSFG